MARPVGWRWSPIPQHLVKAPKYLDLAPPVSAGCLLDRLYAFACDRYGIFVAGFRALRNETGLEGSGPEFDAALAVLERSGFVFLWTSPGDVPLGIVANYSPDGGLPASLFHKRPIIDADMHPPAEVADVCGWVAPEPPQQPHDGPAEPSDVYHGKPQGKSQQSHDDSAELPQQSHSRSSRVETETRDRDREEDREQEDSAEPAPAKAGTEPTPSASPPSPPVEPKPAPVTVESFPAAIQPALVDWLDECVKAGAAKWNRDKQAKRQGPMLLALVEAYGEPTVRRAMEIHTAKGPEYFNRGQMGDRGATQYLNGVCRKTTPDELARWATGAPAAANGNGRAAPARYTGFGVQCGPAPATHVTKARPWGELEWDVAQDYDVDRETWEASRRELGMAI